jgi:predicted Zn finger-like uncharacterized protein
MKSVTTCPSCQTEFLVTDEQLAQYNGKVRCGHCLTVFNAVEHIKVQSEAISSTTESIVEQETTPNLQLTPDETPSNIANQELDIPTPPVDAIIESEVSTEPSNFVADIQEPSPAIVEVTSEKIVDSPLNESAPSKRENILKELFEQANLPLEEVVQNLPLREESIADLNLDIKETVNIDPDDYQEELRNINTFDEKPEYQYYLPEKKSTSPLLIALSVALVLGIVLQCAFYYRHSIAMQAPEFKPTLVKICNALGCKINLPQEIQYFSIDDSTIEEDSNHDGVIHLTSTITNRAEFNQAFPNLEVTLTDTQDKPKLRRIFRPTEYLSKEYRLDDGIASGDSIAVNMPLMADDFKPAGFRLLVSY